jgi:3-phenylpropionate/trans-cinnamate dioxygenase ferredoxin subunit
MEASGTFVAVVPLEELRVGFLTTHVVEDMEVILARTEAGVFAYDATCPHSDFQLVPGRLPKGCLVECPMHGARFDAATGDVVKGPAKEPLQAIEARVEDGVVELLVDWV